MALVTFHDRDLVLPADIPDQIPHVSFAKPDPAIHLQETAEVYIRKTTHKGAEALPVSAVIPGSQVAGVWIVERGRLALRRVSAGIVDKRGYTEILGGVSRDDIVLVRPDASGSAPVAGRRVRTEFIFTSLTPEP